MSEAKLNSFMVYNPTYGTKEGQEHQKIMYYYPETENPDVKVNNIGLCEALVQFAMTFCPSQQCESLYTQRQRQVFYEPEKNFWFIMIVANPWKNVMRDGKSTKEYMESDLSEIVLKKTLERAYKMFKIFFGTLQDILTKKGVTVLQAKLKSFYEKYLKDVSVGNMDVLNVFNGVEYFQSNRTTYLKMKSFLNSLTCDFPEIFSTLLMYEDKLIWSGLHKDDTHIIYRYLVDKLLPKTSDFENELDCSYLTHDASCGQFVAGYNPHANEPHVTEVYVNHQGHIDKAFMVIYKALDVSIVLFISGDSAPSTDILRKLDDALGPSLAEFSTVLESFPHLHLDSSEHVYKFIYFNGGNLSIRSSFHHREKSGVKRYKLPTDVMKEVLSISQEISSKTQTSEVISKTGSDHWVVAKKLDDRHECYIITDQKNANLIEVNEEIQKVYQLHISNVLLSD